MGCTRQEAHPTKGVPGRLYQAQRRYLSGWRHTLPRGYLVGCARLKAHPLPMGCQTFGGTTYQGGGRCSAPPHRRPVLAIACEQSVPWWGGCIPNQGAGVHVAECGGCSCTVVNSPAPNTAMPLRGILRLANPPPRSLAAPPFYGMFGTPYLGGATQRHEPGTNIIVEHYRTLSKKRESIVQPLLPRETPCQGGTAPTTMASAGDSETCDTSQHTKQCTDSLIELTLRQAVRAAAHALAKSGQDAFQLKFVATAKKLKRKGKGGEDKDVFTNAADAFEWPANFSLVKTVCNEWDHGVDVLTKSSKHYLCRAQRKKMFPVQDVHTVKPDPSLGASILKLLKDAFALGMQCGKKCARTPTRTHTACGALCHTSALAD